MRISVRDNGPGMAEEDLERVFEPFVRLEPSRNRNSGGSGIGLAISRNIARWHGGDVKLRNAPGKTGLIAEISLPRVKTPPGSRQGASRRSGWVAGAVADPPSRFRLARQAAGGQSSPPSSGQRSLPRSLPRLLPRLLPRPPPPRPVTASRTPADRAIGTPTGTASPPTAVPKSVTH